MVAGKAGWKRLPRAAVTTPNLTEFTKFLDNTLRPTVCFLGHPMQAQQLDLMILMGSFQFCLFCDFMIKQPMQNKIGATRHRLLTQICHYIINEHNRIPCVYILRYAYANVHINPGQDPSRDFLAQPWIFLLAVYLAGNH